LEHQINQSKRNFFQKKYAWYLKSVKEPNIRMEATRRNLRARVPDGIRPGTQKTIGLKLSSENLNLKRRIV
jgi:hypothetical protein